MPRVVIDVNDMHRLVGIDRTGHIVGKVWQIQFLDLSDGAGKWIPDSPKLPTEHMHSWLVSMDCPAPALEKFIEYRRA